MPTTLSEGSVKVYPVEQVISALTGMGVDNVLIEMDANEAPIGYGSLLPYVECIKVGNRWIDSSQNYLSSFDLAAGYSK